LHSPGRRRIRIRPFSLLNGTITLADAGTTSGLAPEVVATRFYDGYLKALTLNRDPVQDDKKLIARYVTKALLADIDRSRRSPDGMEADYFIRAQDYMDEWLGHVTASTTNIKAGTAEVAVTLGDTPASIHRLKLGFTIENGSWKIRKVY